MDKKKHNVNYKENSVNGEVGSNENATSVIDTYFRRTPKAEYLETLRRTPLQYHRYAGLDEYWKERFIGFMTGSKTLPLIYDPFFKKIFNPDIYPERLSAFISSILGMKVKVKCVLSSAESLLPTNSMLVMDILVQLEDGSIANVEIQKVPYDFLSERISCYSADLLLRQYSRAKSTLGVNFSYRDLKKVYTIVLFEKSTHAFKDDATGGKYLHHGRVIFDTGLKMEMLQEYFLVALDEFNKRKYSETRSERNAWLSLLTADDRKDLIRLISDYPWMEDICRDMSEYMHCPEEVLSMFSEALRIMDENTVKYMIDVRNKQLADAMETIEEKNSELAAKVSLIAEKDSLIAEKDSALVAKSEEMENALAAKSEEMESALAKKDSTIAEKDSALAEKDSALAEKDKALAALTAEMERLKKELAER